MIKMKEIKEMEKLRKNIDKTDYLILCLIKKRIEIVKNIGKIKKRSKIKIINKQREKEILERLEKEAKKIKLNSKFIKSLFKIIILESRKTQ